MSKNHSVKTLQCTDILLSDLLERVQLLGEIVCAYHPAPQTDILEVYFEHILKLNDRKMAKKGTYSKKRPPQLKE